MNSSYPLVFSVTSGKGGVGKTNISVNLALTLAARGKRVLLLDADLGLANVDVLLDICRKVVVLCAALRQNFCAERMDNFRGAAANFAQTDDAHGFSP